MTKFKITNKKIALNRFDGFVNSQKYLSMSFRRKPESSKFNGFWMPVEDPVFSGDQVRHDELGTVYEAIRFGIWNL